MHRGTAVLVRHYELRCIIPYHFQTKKCKKKKLFMVLYVYPFKYEKYNSSGDLSIWHKSMRLVNSEKLQALHGRQTFWIDVLD